MGTEWLQVFLFAIFSDTAAMNILVLVSWCTNARISPTLSFLPS